ncbi:MAG: hypothetical protein J6W28_04780, partial [Clostridia bacterium]|nr:hypothetical protein [Clostridia bacterium]
MKKLLCLCLIACMLCGCLVACNGDGNNDQNDGGDKNGDWANLDFENATLTVSVSKNQPRETTFQASSVYMKGPDNAATSEPVQKKVLARNKKVAEDLNIQIAYQETNWKYSEILPHLEKLVAGDADDAPDVYNNDMYAMFRAMMSGYLWNVTNPGKDAKGNEVKSYFELDSECWYQEYMQGATFSKDKMYILVGDYNIDIIRWASVFFVNIDLWDATFGNLSEEDGWGFSDYESACEFIVDTEDWFYDDLINLASMAHRDGAGGVQDKTDEGDDQIGFAHNACSSRLFTYGSGHSIFEWTKNGKVAKECEGVPSMITDTTDLVNVGLKFTELYNTKGVYHFTEERENSNLDTVQHFMKGKTIMATAALGEMESEQMRNTKFKRGILPYPRYSRDIEHLTTIVHDQAEVSVILNNAKSFSMASAYLQYVNEESTEILNFYYDEVLKFKYNESRGARNMIDLIIGNVTTPFEALMNLYLFDEAGVQALLHAFSRDAKNNAGTTIRST